jgi:hypothetical protein
VTKGKTLWEKKTRAKQINGCYFYVVRQTPQVHTKAKAINTHQFTFYPQRIVD